ncbi:MAG: universal stress protein [Thioploca sp.]|nr:universal stress protein [Thioploca sp.]
MRHYLTWENLIIATLFIGLQVGIWAVYADPQIGTETTPTTSTALVFEPAEPKLETGEKIPLSLHGASGDIVWHSLKGKIEGRGDQVYYLAPAAPGKDTITVTDATGNTATLTIEVSGFLDLQIHNVLFLLFVGFVGGLVSGFIGSGGAFVLTPAMMSMGVPGIVAVASNICHKFPKALVGAMKRAKYGQVDVKLGIIMGISAEIGVLYGAHIQEMIKTRMGDAGSNLYVSVVFVVVLAIVGGYVLRDALKIYRSGNMAEQEEVTKLARWVQSIHIPGTMMYFNSLKARVSVLITIPLGFATGMLAATIAVGGFIGVPSMIYVLGAPSLMASASELVIAFVMGLGGSIKFAWSGFVDIRLAMIILAGSLFGIQLGAIGTTYVKPYMVKLVMGIIMVLVLLSRALMVPIYLSTLGYIDKIDTGIASVVSNISFSMLVGALLTGAIIVLYALWSGWRAHAVEEQAAEVAAMRTSFSLPESTIASQGVFDRMLVASDTSEFSAGALRQAINLAQQDINQLYVMSVLVSNPEYESLVPQLLQNEKQPLLAHLDQVKVQAQQAGVSCEALLRYGTTPYEELVAEAEKSRMSVIVMGRRGKSGVMRTMMGSSTAKVIGFSPVNVLVVPRAAPTISGQPIVVGVDGSRYSERAAAVAKQIAQFLNNAPVVVVSVVYAQHDAARREEANQAVQQTVDSFQAEDIKAEGIVVEGRAAEALVGEATRRNADLIVVGTHGRTGLERVLVGSVSERIIGLASCSVLVVKT